MMEERSPMLPRDANEPFMAPRRRESDGMRRLKQLPLLFALVGAVVAPILLFVDFQTSTTSAVVSQTTDAAIETLPTTASYELNPDGTPNLLKECEEKYFTQQLDNFAAAGGPTYEERYFICSRKNSRKDGAIFFYVGNEADVELYLNNTGLMWENAAEFGALLVFAEHRYFGKSVPFGKNVTKNMHYLSSEQALADYAVLLDYIKQTEELDVPVIGFGGSYGGMLGSWFRMKYPNVIDGVIAASAPIMAFLGDEKPVDTEGFARVTTFDASADAGSAPNCINNVRRVWPAMTKLGLTQEGRDQLAEAFALCKDTKLETESDVAALVDWAKSAYDYAAMGNYPYPSPYIMNGKSVLPAFPVRVMCSFVADSYAENETLSLLRGFRDSIGVYYNSTADQQCYDLNPASNESALDDDFWQYLFCSELYMPQSVDGVHDMFWSVPANITADNESCLSQWNIPLRPRWAVTQYGGRKALRSASNLVLSNGNYDPWSATGVLENVSDSVVFVPVDGGAHHLDLFFSNELDPPAVKAARAIEKTHMWKWVNEYYTQRATVATKA